MVRRAYVLSGAARARFVISPTMPRLARGNYVFEAGDGDKVDLYRLERDLSGIPENRNYVPISLLWRRPRPPYCDDIVNISNGTFEALVSLPPSSPPHRHGVGCRSGALTPKDVVRHL